MTSEFDSYYLNQSGSGTYSGPLWQDGGSIRGFSGRQYQYGDGFKVFGKSLPRWARSIMKYLGREALQTGVNVGSDVLAGKDIKTALTDRVKETGSNIASEAVAVAKKKLTGKGRKKSQDMARRRRRTRKTNKRPVVRARRTILRRRRTRRRRVKKALTDIFS